MALSSSATYHLTVEQLRQTCVERGLNNDEPMRTLRRRLAEQFKSEDMERSEQQDTTQESAPTDLFRTGMGSITPDPGEQSEHDSEGDQASVLVELLRQVAPLSSDEPKEILRFTTWDLPMIDSLSRVCYPSSPVVY